MARDPGTGEWLFNDWFHVGRGEFVLHFYGGYSGAVPNEKITWGKLGIDTPKFIIESDATIVAPLMFARILGW